MRQGVEVVPGQRQRQDRPPVAKGDGQLHLDPRGVLRRRRHQHQQRRAVPRRPRDALQPALARAQAAIEP